ncbi:MAG TPA: SDR family NAD(P)-dependent oxidoreductase [Acidobacteriota bacterium]|nr:SDR family NAD(P)-dependent oxidoreductase [Acidobacteriota bacterium]
MKRVMITGGAGFIGSHLADRLLEKGYDVRVLDSLEPQVHGPSGNPPAYLNRAVEFIRGDVCDRSAVEQAIEGVQVVFHLAAVVGVAQSMYEIDRYVRSNTWGTAVLLQALLDKKSRIEKLVVASSMSLYGEGEFRCNVHGPVLVTERPFEQLQHHRWEPECPACGKPLNPAPTRETKLLYPTSVYALTKKDQEELALIFGRSYGIPVVALRYFNVFGSRQAVSNPYTGAAAIFAARLLNRRRPLIFEDGGQLRDFVHVSDIARANILAMEKSGADGKAVNIGAGRSISVLQIARELTALLGREGIEPEFPGSFRKGDIRHCFADIALAREWLGYEAQCSFMDGMRETVEWMLNQKAEDRVDHSLQELKSRGLTE